MSERTTQERARSEPDRRGGEARARERAHAAPLRPHRPAARRPGGPRPATACTRPRTSSGCRRCCSTRSSGFGLGEIRDLLAEPGFDRREALRAQRDAARAPVRPHRRHARPHRQDAGRDGRRDTDGTQRHVRGLRRLRPGGARGGGRGALGRDRGLQGVGAAHAPVHEGRLGAVQGRERRRERGDRDAHGRGRRAGRSARHGRRRAAPPADRHVVLPVLRTRCTSSSGGCTWRTPRFAATYEKIRPGMAAVRARRDRGQRAPGGETSRQRRAGRLLAVRRRRQRRRHDAVVGQRLEAGAPVHGLGDEVVHADLDPQGAHPELRAGPARPRRGRPCRAPRRAPPGARRSRRRRPPCRRTPWRTRR